MPYPVPNIMSHRRRRSTHRPRVSRIPWVLFASFRLRGEWFTPADELLDFLAESIDGYPTAALYKIRARRAA